MNAEADAPDLKGMPEKFHDQGQNRDGDIVVPYTEPAWGSTPPPNYKIEVLKGGKILSEIPLNTSYLVVGRLQSCNIVLEHPSVSRFHAVIQYCPGDNTRIKGFYIYDLGSTHGTLLNKKQISAKVYYKVEIGHILKFGGSTRLHILQGPEEDVNEQHADESEPVCDWGITEDADEEEDLAVNPYALSTANEELYLDDPKKTLRGWFEREGYELEYDVEEKGYATFICRVQLPVDTPTGEYPVAEATVKGKKKEAVVACALEACRILDRHGVLRQAHHENRQKKRKNWEDEDFYDSDEDTYLDRTGTIEKKREIRKKMVKKEEKIETYQSLTLKLGSVNKDIAETERKIQNCIVSLDAQSDDDKDSLEAYMSQIEGHTGSVTDKVTKSKLKLQLAELLKERSRLEKLLDVAKPVALPTVSKVLGIIGKRPTKKFQLPTVAKPPEIKKTENEEEEEEEEEEDSDSERPLPEVPSCAPASSSAKNSEQFVKVTSDKLFQASRTNSKATNVKGTLEKESASEKLCVPKRTVAVYGTNDSDYSMWVPPDNQTGDGTTHLNAKYGY